MSETERRRPRCVLCGARAIYDPQGRRYIHEDPAVSLAADHAARVILAPAPAGDSGGERGRSPATVRIVADTESGYVGDGGEVWTDPAGHGPDQSGSLPGEPPSCRCGYNGTPEECLAARSPR